MSTWGEDGLTWSGDGREVLFSASQGGAYLALAVNVSGPPVVKHRVATAGSMGVRDAASDGRLLVVNSDIKATIRALIPGESAEREFAWLDTPILGRLSNDRRALAFTDLNETAGKNYAVALRDLASERTVRLGEGASFGVSPDGRWAGGLVPTQDLMLYPTGAGQPVHLSRGPIETYTGNDVFAEWFPDSAAILVCGYEKGKAPRCYKQNISGGAPEAVTPEGVRQAWLSPDGKTLLGDRGSGAYEIRSIGSSSAVAAKGLTPADVIVGWSGDGRSVIVNAGNAVPARVEIVNVTTGARTFLREIAPPNAAGVTTLTVSQWLDSGYVYSYRRTLDAIYVVRQEGG